MAETWAADLMFAEELGMSRADVARGAVVFVLRRGASVWCRRLWVRITLVVLALSVATFVVPPWLVLPVVALGLLAWLISSPVRRNNAGAREQ